jgi:hypothetical protein
MRNSGEIGIRVALVGPKKEQVLNTTKFSVPLRVFLPCFLRVSPVFLVCASESSCEKQILRV